FINARFLWTDEICVFGEPSQTPEYVKGDVNGDGKINEYDYILVARAILGTYTLDETETLASDIDNNGIINEYDYILIARHHFGTYVIQ
ncbi:MAG: dockerin type I repeat-containing protein, partial [Clostridia bacterium]|nr:dockerin type I repeat-containing protein [Clostridia bacterium]